MKIMPFSHEVCDYLLANGFIHLVLKYNFTDEDAFILEGAITLEALRNTKANLSIPLKEMMHLPKDKLTKYYVMFDDVTAN